MSERNVEIAGANAKTLCEFIRAHNIAMDGQRLGQRFVNIYISKPWPELFHERSDKKAMEVIQKYLTDHHHFDSMPLLRK